MAERTNPHANLIIGAQDEASPVFDKIKASSQSMAAGVEQAATKAAGAVGGIGDKAAPAAQKLDGVTASMIRQVQRLNAELEAGGARNAAYFEKMASVKGADLSAMAPYLADLKKAEAAQRVATTGLDQMGVSAKQTTAALRQVPMQFTDIVVSLQGGQSAMQVFLQQGGQLKDMFGGAGNAVRALGGYVAGLVNPFTIAAAAIASIAVAYKQGSAEADGYRMALVMTGNAAGTTAAQMQQMAGRISSVVGTQGAAADALAQMASSGRVASQSLEYFSEVSIKFERTTGTAISETVKRFAELGASPVDASRKLNEETNYLTASIYEQIKALKDQGREADAAALAQNTYADALNNRSAQITQNLGAIEGAWKAIKDAAKSGWDAMLNVGRADSLGTQIDNMRAKIAQAKGQDKNRPFSMPWDTSLADLEKQLSFLTEQERMIRRGAEAQAQRTQAEKEAIAATDALQKTQASGLTNQQKMNKALEEYARHIEKLKATNPASVLLSPDAIARGEKAIRDQFSDKGKGSAGIKAVNKDLADQAKLIAELNGLTGSFAKEWDTLSAVYAKGGMSLEQLTSAQAALLAKQPAIKAFADEQSKAQQVIAKANLDAAASREKYITSLSTGLDKIQADITAQIEATERMGLSKEAIAELDAAKLEMLATDLELQAIKAMDRNLDQQTYDALKAQAAAYRDLGIAKKGGAAKEAALDLEKANADAAKKAQEDWERASEQINSTLTDALMRGFESGKDFAKNLRDTVVNMFKTMVLRPVISAIVSPVAGAVTGMMGLSGAANASTGGASMLGNVGSAYRAASGFNMGWLTNFGATLPGSIASTGADLFSKGFETVGSSMMDFGNSIAGYADAINVAGDVLGYGAAIFAAANGKWGQAIGSAVGTYFGGPIGSFIGSTIGKWADKIFSGGAGTPHSGGGLIYSAENGIRGGAENYNGQNFGMGMAEEYNPEVEKLIGPLAIGLVTTFDGIAKTFGKTAGYEIATAFADDTDKDGAWGSLRISQAGKGLLNWDDTRESKWAPREFANGEEGYKEYLAEIAKDTRTVLLEMDLPSWADTMLESIGEAANMDQLAAAVQQIGVIQTTFVQLGKTMEGFAGLTDQAFEALMRASGGFESLVANAGAYYENFYSEAEKTAAVTRSVSESLAQVGLAMPTTREEFRALVESQMALGDAGTDAVAALLGVSGAFASVTAASETAAEAAARLADEQGKAAEAAARAAEKAAEEAARAYEKTLSYLTKKAETAMQILGAAVDREKQTQNAGYEAQMAIIEAQRKAANTAMDAQRAWLGVAIGGAQNYAKALESEANRIRGYFTGMVLQDDPDAPAGASVFSAQAALRAGDKSDAVLRKATDIDPEMFASWADYAVNFFETQGLVGGALQGAERAASEAASDVALLEQQLTLAEDKYKTDLEHYTKLEGIAKETLDSNLLRLDALVQAAQDQLAEATGTKLTVMTIAQAMGNFSGAIGKLAYFTGNAITTPLPTAPVLTPFGSQTADLSYAPPVVYSPVAYGGSGQASSNDRVVAALQDVLAELQALRSTGADTKAAVEKTSAILDQVTAGGNAMLTETA